MTRDGSQSDREIALSTNIKIGDAQKRSTMVIPQTKPKTTLDKAPKHSGSSKVQPASLAILQEEKSTLMSPEDLRDLAPPIIEDEELRGSAVLC